MKKFEYGSIVNWSCRKIRKWNGLSFSDSEEETIPCIIKKYWEEDDILNCHKMKIIPMGDFSDRFLMENVYLCDFKQMVKDNPSIIRLT
jgi:hypothetical protein